MEGQPQVSSEFDRQSSEGAGELYSVTVRSPPRSRVREALERWPITSLTPYARNARTHSAEQIALIAASMKQFGYTTPVLVRSDGVIVAGHGRLLAAAELGYSEVPVLVIDGWTDEECRAYVIADNQIASEAGWDRELLKLEIGELRDAGFDLSLTGFDQDTLSRILDIRLEGLADPDSLPELSAASVSVHGDIWQLGKHRLMCGSSTVHSDVNRLLAGATPHLMVTDPPYGVEYDPDWRQRAGINKNALKLGAVANDDRADWLDAWRLFHGSVAYVWHAGRFASEVQQSLAAAGFEVRAQIIWAKERFALSRGHYHWQHEPCWYAVRGTGGAHWTGDRSQSSLWTINAREDAGHGHGTQKPVECMRRPIANNSRIGDAVYEPFCGAGTTIIASEMTERICLAMEIEPRYVDLAVRRWQDFTGCEAVLEAGATFAEVAEQRAVAQ